MIIILIGAVFLAVVLLMLSKTMGRHKEVIDKKHPKKRKKKEIHL